MNPAPEATDEDEGDDGAALVEGVPEGDAERPRRQVSREREVRPDERKVKLSDRICVAEKLVNTLL